MSNQSEHLSYPIARIPRPYIGAQQIIVVPAGDRHFAVSQFSCQMSIHSLLIEIGLAILSTSEYFFEPHFFSWRQFRESCKDRYRSCKLQMDLLIDA
jgi:hypothetical protein